MSVGCFCLLASFPRHRRPELVLSGVKHRQIKL